MAPWSVFWFNKKVQEIVKITDTWLLILHANLHKFLIFSLKVSNCVFVRHSNETWENSRPLEDFHCCYLLFCCVLLASAWYRVGKPNNCWAEHRRKKTPWPKNLEVIMQSRKWIPGKNFGARSLVRCVLADGIACLLPLKNSWSCKQPKAQRDLIAAPGSAPLKNPQAQNMLNRSGT